MGDDLHIFNCLNRFAERFSVSLVLRMCREKRIPLVAIDLYVEEPGIVVKAIIIEPLSVVGVIVREGN